MFESVKNTVISAASLFPAVCFCDDVRKVRLCDSSVYYDISLFYALEMAML